MSGYHDHAYTMSVTGWKEEANKLYQFGLFRAAKGLHVLACFGRVWAPSDDGDVNDDAYANTQKVRHVDVFVSHSWSADQWAKHLAMCFFLNFRLAVKTALAALAASQCLVLLVSDLSIECLFLALMDVPVLLFFVTFFFGQHLLCGFLGSTLWVDKLCVEQGSEEKKSRTIKGLPAIVSSSTEMLVLWDRTYFERLWCNFELSVFIKCRGVENLRFVPLWLAPWLLLTMLFAYVSCRLIAFAHGSNPEFGLDSTAVHTKAWGSPLEYGFQRMLMYLPDTQAYAFFYIPGLIVSLFGFQTKLSGHEMMLSQMANFDIRNAKCSDEKDRHVIEMQVAGLFDGTEESTIRVPAETGQDPEEQRRLSLTSRLAIRTATGFPEVGASLDAFNDYVRNPARDGVIEDLGTETHLPWGICVLTWVPTVLCLTAITWTGRPVWEQLGYASVEQYFLLNYIQFVLLLTVLYPAIHPCILGLLKRLSDRITNKCLLNAVMFGCGILTLSLIFMTSSITIAALESYVLTSHPVFLFVFILMLTCHLLLDYTMFWQDDYCLLSDLLSSRFD